MLVFLKLVFLVNKYIIIPTPRPPNIAAIGIGIIFFKLRFITRQAKNPAPLPIPSTSVDASGFLRTPWKIAPAIAKLIPTIIVINNLGTLYSKIIKEYLEVE